MKIFNQAGLKAWDEATQKELSGTMIDSGLLLMHRAAQKFAEVLLQRLKLKGRTFWIFVGPGNNGGDGLVVAQLLALSGELVQVVILQKTGTPAFQRELISFQGLCPHSTHLWQPETSSGAFLDIISAPEAIIIDALFGLGLNRDLSREVQTLILWLNSLPNLKIALDIPSGLLPEGFLPHTTPFQADYTLTVENYKYNFLLNDYLKTVGQVLPISVGLSSKFYVETITTNLTLDEIEVNHILQSFAEKRPEAFYWLENKLHRQKNTHKYTYGHALVVAGSEGRLGCSVLAAEATLRSGAGLVSIQARPTTYLFFQTKLPEALLVADGGQSSLVNPYQSDLWPKPPAAVLLGPGLGRTSAQLILSYLQTCPSPLILDADFFSLWALMPELGQSLQSRKDADDSIPILTPHAGEFARILPLAMPKSNFMEKEPSQLSSAELLCLGQEFSELYHCILVLKGPHTCIINPSGRQFFNTSGNAGLATAGSGDVLAGIITGLKAQGLDSFGAASLGVFLHGKAAEIACQTSIIASDLINHLPKALQSCSFP